MLIGRDATLDQVRHVLDSSGPELILLEGPRGIGKTALIRELLSGRPGAYHPAPPFSGPGQIETLAASVRAAVLQHAAPAPDDGGRVVRRRRLPPDTPEDRLAQALDPLEELAERSAHQPGSDGDHGFTWVIDDVQYLAEGNPWLAPALEAAFERILSRQGNVNVIVAGSSSPSVAALMAEDSPFGRLATLKVDLPQLSYRAAAAWYPELSPEDCVRAYAVFGGNPGILTRLRADRGLAANVRSLVLEPGAPLAVLPLTHLHASVQSVGRYAELMSAIAGGAHRWGEILSASPAFPTGGQMTPYLQRLERLGAVRRTGSLDDAAGARNHRYRLVDPFERFWYRFVLPARDTVAMGRGGGLWSGTILPALDRFVGPVFERICRQYLRDHADELFPVGAREVGAIWNTDGSLHIPVAGTLAGGAVCYGTARWPSVPAGSGTLDELREAIRRTRYGVARMTRTQLVFSGTDAPTDLRREAAADEAVRLVGLEHLYAPERRA